MSESTTDQSSREQEREVPRPAKAKGWSALDLHAAQCYEDAQRFAPRLPDPPTVSAPTAGQLQLSALWELQARVGDAHENHGRNDERTMKAREVFYEALRSALSTHPTAITAEEAGREWLPIETAPKDRRILLGYAPDADHEDGYVAEGRWWEGYDDAPDDMGSDGGFMDSEFQFFRCPRSFGAEQYRTNGLQPTRWQPLPPAPAQSGGQGNG